MLASSFFDAMLGIDIHWEMVPMPAPVPTPIPNPFTGIVKDFTGLAVGLALSNAIGAATGGSPKGPVLYWGGIPATNTGTNGEHVPGHILIPPGTAWAPVPKTPKPVVRPNEKPKPPKPVSPDNDAIIVFGSKTVTVMGTNAVRMGDLAMSCSEPVRLPSTVVMAVPKGAPILIGGPMSLDVMAAIFASLRTRFIGDSLQAGISRLPLGARGRAVLSWIACKLTGHPVDVASGKMMTRALDADLPGPLPFTIERFYQSNFASRRGPLGHGWSCSLDQAVWEERGKMVLLAEDGREIEFDTFDFPAHRMRVGDEVWNPINRLMLRCEAKGKWCVTAHDGVYREFAPVPGKTDGRARIQRIVSRCEYHDITFTYDGRGRLEWVRDSAGRLIGIEQDEHDRIVALKLPHPHEHGWYVHRWYAYDAEGDLVRAVDSVGNTWSFEYVTHLMVRETDRTGLSFYFEYDGLGEDAWCTRTWGDGGIYDHVINYDKKNHVTYVTNSLSHTTQYHMNAAGLVTKIVNPQGAGTEYQYDERTLQKTRETNAVGDTTTWTHDDRGNITRIVYPEGSEAMVEYNDRNQRVTAITATGGRWEWTYDESGQFVAERHPTDGLVRYGYQEGVLAWAEELAFQGRQFTLDYSGHKEVMRARLPSGSVIMYQHDNLGRVTRRINARGGIIDFAYDFCGQMVRAKTAVGTTIDLVYDAEERLQEIVQDSRRVRLSYGNFGRVVAREEAGTRQQYDFDTEGKLVAVVNEAGEVYRFERDDCGRVVGETGFDSHTTRYRYDAGGRIIETNLPGGRTIRYDYLSGGRLAHVYYSGGGAIEFAYDAGGLLKSAENETSKLEFAWDVAGHLVEETCGEFRVISRYGFGPERTAYETSLGARARFHYNSDRQVVGIAFGPTLDREPGLIVALSRGPDGLEESRQLPGNVRLEWERDAAGRPLERRIIIGPAGAGRAQEARHYQWHGVDQIVAVVESGRGATRYGYDNRGNMVSAHDANSHGTYSVRDPVGNIYYGPDSRDRRYGPGGRLETAEGMNFVYDEEGKLIERCNADGAIWRYRWNGAGLLREVERPDGKCVRFEYDALARRTHKMVVRPNTGGEVIEDETQFFWDRHLLVHEVSNTNSVVTWYWHPEAYMLVGREQGSRCWTVASDHLGTPTEMYDESGALIWQMRLDIHGRPSCEKGSAADCPFRWPGQYHDQETGLYYNRYRYYDPQIGAYISPDPLRLQGGLNLFGYVDDVNTQFDPFGLHIIEAFLDGVPVINPANGYNLWPNTYRSGQAGLAPSGYGRLGDSENLLMEHLAQRGREALEGKTLTIDSLGEPRMNPPGSPLPPCHHCDPGLQKFADDFGVEIRYTPEGQGRGGEYRPCGG